MARRSRPKRLPHNLTDGEIDRVMAQINTRCSTGLRNRALLQTMTGAGLRISEALALMPRDINLTDGLIRVNRGKGHKDRVVPIAGETTAWIEAWANKREVLGFDGRQSFFCGLRTKGKGLKPRYVQELVSRLADRAGVEKHVTPHTLRHTYATRMLRDGFTIREVQELLGHASIQTTQVYTHVDPQELKRKVQGGEASTDPKADDVVWRLAEAIAGLTQEQKQALAVAMGVG